MLGTAGIVTASLPGSAAAIDLKDFGGKEGQDIGPALERAVESGGGAPITIGPGEYWLGKPFVYRNRDKFLTSSRGPGIVLVGSGSQRTIIQCVAQGPAAIEVAQERPYRFTTGGRFEGFSLRGNPKALAQDGLRLSGAWNYTIADVDIVGFTGHGLSIPWREDLRWALNDVEIVAGSKVAHRRNKDGFTDDTGLTGAMRIFGPGIPAGATISRLVDGQTLEMSASATQTGTYTLEFVGNVDAFQSIVELNGCRFLGNDGWGLWGGAGIGAAVSWIQTEAAQNRTGGVFCGGNAWSLRGGSINTSEGVGLLVDRVPGGGGPLMLNVERIEFDSNTGGHVWLKQMSGASFQRCRFISHYSASTGKHRPEIGLIIGNTPVNGLVRGVELKGCHFRAPPNEPASYSAIRFGAPGGYRHVELVDSPWIVRAPHHRLFDNDPDPSASVLVRQDGITTYASRTPRAWAVVERTAIQRIPSGRLTELLHDLVQGTLAGGASAQRLLRARAVAGSDQLELADVDRGLKPGLPIAADDGRFVADGSTIVSVNGKQVQISAAATSSGEFGLIAGGLRIPYTHVYEVEASVTLEGLTAGSAIDLALTVAGRIVRRSTVPAGALSRQTVAIRALLPLQAEARIGLRVAHDGRHEVSALGGAEGGAFSLIAAT